LSTLPGSEVQRMTAANGSSVVGKSRCCSCSARCARPTARCVLPPTMPESCSGTHRRYLLESDYVVGGASLQ
jgi:hypothetical protein